MSVKASSRFILRPPHLRGGHRSSWAVSGTPVRRMSPVVRRAARATTHSLPDRVDPPDQLNYAAMTEEELAAIAAQDPIKAEAAWSELYRRVWPFAIRVAFAVARRRQGVTVAEHNAADFAQEGLLRAWEYRHRYRGGRYRAWLSTIIANRVRTLCRREASAKRALDSIGSASEATAFLLPWHADDSSSPLEQVEALERNKVVFDALDRLMPEDRALLLLWVQDRHHELRDRHGGPLNGATLRSRIWRARRKFARAVEDLGLTAQGLAS